MCVFSTFQPLLCRILQRTNWFYQDWPHAAHMYELAFSLPREPKAVLIGNEMQSTLSISHYWDLIGCYCVLTTSCLVSPHPPRPPTSPTPTPLLNPIDHACRNLTNPFIHVQTALVPLPELHLLWRAGKLADWIACTIDHKTNSLLAHPKLYTLWLLMKNTYSPCTLTPSCMQIC